ncbi:MAG: GNAT family N-acetyltransferase [Bradymonadia bacterium]
MSDTTTFGPWRAQVEPFEADFFGGPVWRLSLEEADASEEAIKQGIEEATKAARAGGVRLMVSRVPTSGAEATAALASAGFNAIETLVTFKRSLEGIEATMPERVRPIAEGDDRPLVQLGRAAFNYDRYHADPMIMDPIADAIKGAWVENGINGRADVTLVAEHEGRPVGFNLCMLRGDTAIIDLIAVERRCQGQGLGTDLVKGALAWFSDKATTLCVGTQTNNAPSVKMYTTCGFEVASEVKTFHWHP